MPPTRGTQRRYSEEERRAALELAANVGRRPAVRSLGISSATLQRWIEEMPEFWSDLRAGDRTVHKTRVAQNLEDLADQYSSLEFEALERAEKLLPHTDAKELAALMKAMGASRGVATVGARGYRGEDHDVTELTINFPALEAAAEAILNRAPQPRLVENTADSTADDDSE